MSFLLISNDFSPVGLSIVCLLFYFNARVFLIEKRIFHRFQCNVSSGTYNFCDDWRGVGVLPTSMSIEYPSVSIFLFTTDGKITLRKYALIGDPSSVNPFFLYFYRPYAKVAALKLFFCSYSK